MFRCRKFEKEKALGFEKKRLKKSLGLGFWGSILERRERKFLERETCFVLNLFEVDNNL